MIHDRGILGVVLALSFGVPVFGQADATTGPRGGTAPAELSKDAAPARRELSGEDAQRVHVLRQAMDRLRQAGRYAEASTPAQEVLDIRRRALGEDHPDTATSYNNLAYFLHSQGKYAEAEPLNQKALAIRRRVLGEDHPDTANSYNNLARLLQEQGKYEEAEPLSRKALGIRRRVLGEDHPDTARSYDNLAALLIQGQGKYAEAEPLSRKALAIRRRTLGEDHPETASSYNNLAYLLHSQGKYAEAEPLFQEALAICRRTRGEDHPDTAVSYNNLGLLLQAQGKHTEAEPMYQKALAIRRRVLGEDHPDTANSYNNLGSLFQAQGKYADAETFFKKSLDISLRVLSEDHPHTAGIYNNLASLLEAQRKYGEAETLYRKALEIRRRVLGEDHPELAQACLNLALLMYVRGNYAEADALLRKGLAIQRRTLGEVHRDTVHSYNNLAVLLQQQGKSVEAEPLLRMSLESTRLLHGEVNNETATSYDNLASILQDQGKREEAERLYSKALDIYRQTPNEEQIVTATGYGYLATLLDDQGKHADAESLFRKALDIRLRIQGEDDLETAKSYEMLGGNLHRQGKYAESVSLNQKALDIFRLVLGEDHPNTVSCYRNQGIVLRDQGKFAEAEAMLTRATSGYEVARRRISGSGLERITFAVDRSPLSDLAALLARRGQAGPAWERLEADLARGTFDDLARPLEPQERDREQGLQGHLHLLDEQISALTSSPNRDGMHQERADAIRRRRESAQGELAEFRSMIINKYGAVAGQPYDLPRIQRQIPSDTALVAWIDFDPRLVDQREVANPRGVHWACVVRSQGGPIWVQIQGRGADGLWTMDDIQSPTDVETVVRTRPEGRAVNWRAKAGALGSQRFDPLDPYLGLRSDLPAVKHLIILTSPPMTGVPIETLLEARPPDRPRYTVNYAPSGTILAWLRERPRPGRKRGDVPHRLLALGDPLFAEPEAPSTLPPPPPDHGVLVQLVLPGSAADRAGITPGDVLLRYADKELNTPGDLTARIAQGGAPGPGFVVSVWRQGKTLDITVPPDHLGVALDNRPAAEAIVARREADEVLRRSRGEVPAPLPGTRREVEAIACLFDQSKTLLGPDASEERLDALASADQLRRFDVLHLATHGAANERSPMLSKVLLASDGRSDAAERVLKGLPVYDGELTAEQILRTWKLDADLVTLSACETGLGRQSSGEGYLGFVQALFLAGARSLVLSLWKVDDTATALLMTRFYENLLGKRAGLDRPMPKGEALREAKQWLRELTDDQIETALSALERGKVRPMAKEPDRPMGPSAPAVASAPRRFEHPYYWAAFILVGDPW